MRLISTDETSPKFVDVTGSPEPYAVFSHTWLSPDAEVTFQELRTVFASLDDPGLETRHITSKAGFEKISRAVTGAAGAGHKYIWIDTCCIDKTSSAEVDEAIRCMFEWYRNASVCYAYLSDVQLPASASWQDATASLKSSRWFTRGWTLQEFVAPRDVVFLAADWSVFGSKMGSSLLRQALAEASGIDAKVLNGSIPVQSVSVSARMQWAAHRQTMLVEDAAYCLMGLFGVDMPIMYGEGMAAFDRLQEEMLKTSDDHPLVVWAATDREDDEMGGLLPRFTISHEHLSGADCVGYKLEGVYPEAHWDGHSCFEATNSSLGRPIAIFRFSSMINSAVGVDVAVGLRREGPQNWNPWHIQRRCSGQSLRSVFNLVEIEVAKAVIFSTSTKRWSSLQPNDAVGQSWLIGKFVDSNVDITATESPSDAAEGRVSYVIRIRAIPELPSQPISIRLLDGAAFREQPPVTASKELYESLLTQCYRLFQPRTVDNSIEWSVFPRMTLTDKVRTSPLPHEELRDLLDSAVIKARPGVTPLISTWTTFLRACKAGNADCVARLLEENWDVAYRARLIECETATFHQFRGLHWAAVGGHLEVVRLLVDAGADLGSLTREGWSALHLATIMGHHAIITVLFKAVGRITRALNKGKARHRLRLIRGRDRPYSPALQESIYHIAAAIPTHFASGDLDTEFWHEWEWWKWGVTRLEWFSPEIGSYRREDDADDDLRLPAIPRLRNYLDETPLHRAAATGNVGVAKLIIESSKLAVHDVDKYGRTVLWHAACGDHVEIIRMLVANGAALDVGDDDGVAPLHIACINKHSSAVHVLLELGACPNIRTHTPGFTPAHYARADWRCLLELQHAGADTQPTTFPSWLEIAPSDIDDIKHASFHRWTPRKRYGVNFR